MSDSVGIGSWMWLIIAAIVLVGLALGLYRWRPAHFGRARDEDELLDGGEAEGRLEVLESTPVDAQRRLVLVRCDNVEHLIMVGGPADLVVESDVRKSRTSKGSARQPADSLARIASPPADHGAPERADMPAPRRSEPAPAPEAAVRPEPILPEAKPATLLASDSKAAQSGPGASERKQDETKLIDTSAPETRPGDVTPARLSGPSRPTLTAVPGAAMQPVGRKEAGQAALAPASGQDRRNGDAAAGQKVDDAGDARPGRSRPRAPETQPSARREPQPSIERRTPAIQPVAPNANRDGERGRAQPAANRDGPAPGEKRGSGPGSDQAGQRAAILPPAEVPWPEPDSVESESHVSPRHGAATAAAGQRAPSVGKSDPATTLGDLAERLEEALAREVQSANKGRDRLDSSLDAFSFDREEAENSAPEQTQHVPQKERRDPKVLPPAPEAEARRDTRPQPERPEEAPVINLHQRRRETVDPLEDEMARLLGELTGDTNRR